MRTLLCLAVLSAHPIEEKVYDRTISVRLTDSAVVVNYVLEVNGRTAYSDVPDLVSKAELAEITRAEQVYRAFLNGLAPQLRKTLYATLDGKELTFVCKEKQFRVLDHLRCEYRFEAAWPPAGTRHRFVFREPNFEDEKGTVRLSLTAAAGVKLISSTQPDEALLKRNPLDFRPGDQERLRTAEAVFELPSTRSAPTQAPSASAGTQARSASAGTDTPPRKRSLEELILHSGLGFGALLVVVAFFGAAHALTPGHGKTLVAAYLVGERGTFGHALLLGLVVTLTHTSSVLLLAALLYFVPGVSLPSLHSALVFGGGLLIAALGFWLLLRRLAGQADHVHLIGHHHHHAHGHEHLPPDRPVTLGSLFLLGIGGGIIPCADAIVIFVLCVKWQRPQLALPLVVAFSAGLAVVLVTIGMGVVCAKNLSLARWGERPRVQKFFRLLPLVSAVTITLVGLWMCSAGVHSAGG